MRSLGEVLLFCGRATSVFRRWWDVHVVFTGSSPARFRLRFAMLKPFARLATVLSAGVLLSGTVGAVAPQPPTAAVPPTLQQLKLSPGDPHLPKLFSWADGAAGTAKTVYTAPAAAFPAVSETSIDVGAPGVSAPANATCSPVITKISGKFSTYDGDILIDGTCFGPYATGKLVITGFPNGNPQMSIVSWTPTVISANFPTITGVPNLTMHVQVSNGTLSSKPVDAQFVASWGDPIALPSKYVVNKTCGQPGACSSSPHSPTGAHWSGEDSGVAGQDVWTLTLPDHFQLSAINLVVLKGQVEDNGAVSSATLLNSSGGGNSNTYTVDWFTDAVGPLKTQTIQVPTQGCSVDWGDIIVGIVTDDYIEIADGVTSSGCSSGYGWETVKLPTYDEAYRLQVLVRGPAGMTP